MAKPRRNAVRREHLHGCVAAQVEHGLDFVSKGAARKFAAFRRAPQSKTLGLQGFSWIERAGTGFAIQERQTLAVPSIQKGFPAIPEASFFLRLFRPPGRLREMSDSTSGLTVEQPMFGETLTGGERRKRARLRVPAITILFHPDIRRTGERATSARWQQRADRVRVGMSYVF